ncbi:MAG TPA: menaquinone biosynthesis protein [Geobacteraceae bacterium]|nr:menaquinone biosynthesis protein [Geobacteraceae bacterium]
MLRIGEISYLNCTPIFTVLRDHFEDSGYDFVRGTPAELNARLRNGEIDLCPSSSIEYARNPGSYLILPDLSISSVGAVKSVLLFSHIPIERLDGASIALTGESETSVVLLKILLSRRYSFTNSFYTVEGPAKNLAFRDDPLLLIGDNALRESFNRKDRYVYDLGELWYQFTGTPFVFALWLLRQEFACIDPVTTATVCERLAESRRIAIRSYRDIAESSKINWTNRDFLINYWNTISYELTPSHIEGLKLFYRFAADASLIDSEPPLRIFGYQDTA